MSINSLASVQSLISKNKSVPPPPVTISNLNAPAPFQPFFYLSESTTVRNSSNNQVSECTCVVSNQTSPYAFTNGTY
jgi:hypothetical protein